MFSDSQPLKRFQWTPTGSGYQGIFKGLKHEKEHRIKLIFWHHKINKKLIERSNSQTSLTGLQTCWCNGFDQPTGRLSWLTYINRKKDQWYKLGQEKLHLRLKLKEGVCRFLGLKCRTASKCMSLNYTNPIPLVLLRTPCGRNYRAAST
jgi:hypothetical protein